MQLATILLMAPDSIEGALDLLMTSMYVESKVFIGLGQALGGLGTLMYIFFRIWGHLARNEEIDVYPLFRPVALAFCLLFYNSISGGIVTMNKTFDDSTSSIVTSKKATIDRLNTEKDRQLKIKREAASAIDIDFNSDGDMSWWETMISWVPGVAMGNYLGNAISYMMSIFFDEFLQMFGKIMFNVASLGLKFFQTFFLLIMLITGPITIGLACFEWFYSGLASWAVRVIHLLMWLPLTNLLGGMLETIHITMLEQDILQITGGTVDEYAVVDFGMIAFYLLGSAGYFMIPTAASWVVESSGAGQAIAKLSGGAKLMGATAGSAAGAVSGSIKTMMFKKTENAV